MFFSIFENFNDKLIPTIYDNFALVNAYQNTF